MRTLFAISTMLLLVGCATAPKMAATAPESNTSTNVQSKVEELTLKFQVMDLTRRVENLELELGRRRALLEGLRATRTNTTHRVRSKSKLVVQPKTEQNMNLLGERFPVKTWQIRQKNLDGVKFKKPKPKTVTPLAPDSRAMPTPSKSETSINDANKETK